MAQIAAPLTSPSRRSVLKAAAAGALMIGFRIAPSDADSVLPSNFSPNAFLRIDADDTVTVICKFVEMGQGVYTGVATIVAEELDADWSQVRVESAPVDPDLYLNKRLNIQGTAGSWSMDASWDQLREAGAKARAMLVAAAAAEWNIPLIDITVSQGVVRTKSGDHKASFGKLAAAAAKLSEPESVVLKNPQDFTLIGTSPPRVDVPPKTNGSAVYGIDVTLPGMLVGVVQRPPLFGAKVRSFDAAAAMRVAGVVAVIEVPSGIAVVGKSFWAAKSGREALVVDWNDSDAEKRGSDDLAIAYRALAEKPGLPARREGDVEAGLGAAATRLQAIFDFPYLAHAQLEPLTAVVKLDSSHCEIWAALQFQSVDRGFNAAAAAGLKPEQVKINTLLAGGSFGRRATATSDWLVEAVSVAKALGATGVPVKVQWTREDDTQGGYYRPLYVHKLEAGLDSAGALTGWRHRIVGQSINAGTVFAARAVKDGIDVTSVRGAFNLAYDLPNISVELTSPIAGIPPNSLRVVASSHTTYAVETFIDEVAYAATRDPLAFRQALLAKSPRHLAVLNLAAAKAGWGTPMPKGKGRGIALAEVANTILAQVADVSVGSDGRISVDRVVCAVDCGTAINPDIVAAQIEGGIGFGLGAALYGAITLRNGKVEQSNFDTYRVLRMDAMPRVEVHILPSTKPPSGIGEPGVAPIGPAVANAVFAATGKRIHQLPFASSGLA